MGLRASEGHLRQREGRRKVGCILFLVILSFGIDSASSNRLPKFPSASKTQPDDKTEVLSKSTRSVQSDSASGKLDSADSSQQEVGSNQVGSNQTLQTGQIDVSYDQNLQDAWKSVKDAKKTSPLDKLRTKSDGNSSVSVKARLKPTDIFNKGGKKKEPHAKKLVTAGKHTQPFNYTEARLKRSGILDIVLTHYDIARTEEMVNYWLNFLQSDKVQSLRPYVFIYCQNEKYDLGEEDFRPILQLGGEIHHLENIGRESHAYLDHIIKHHGDLAEYTLFAQDESDIQLPERFEMLFEYGKTGFLPLSLVGHVDCDDPFLPAGVIPQIYAMFANELCPPVGYTSSFQGQFVVSKARIHRNGYWTYQRLQDVLSADENHWIHQTHDNTHYKSKSNPLFGHVVERAWSVAFDCFESWREGNCWHCIVVQGMHNCGAGDCQCFDETP